MYKVVFKLLSPMHIGWRKIGNLQQTRYYVPGRTLWGALTARIARDCGNFKYEETGKKVDKYLRFTYFYPSDNAEKISLLPWKSPDEFEWKYIRSYVNTALDFEDNKEKRAKESSLHETEYISPRTRDGNQVYLIGYIFERNDWNLKWGNVLSEIQLGGERTYGWGRIKLEDCSKADSLDFNGFHMDFNLAGEAPIIKVPTSCPVISHVLVDDQINNHVTSGNIEPLVGLETDTQKGSFGSKVSSAKICWTPGTKFKKEFNFSICERGIWKFKQL